MVLLLLLDHLPYSGIHFREADTGLTYFGAARADVLYTIRNHAVKVYESIENVDPPIQGSVLTIGNFDGVHRGHQQLLAQAGLFAANTGGPVVVMTFDPHPVSIVRPDFTPKRLMPLNEKLLRLREAGADVVVVARSEPKLFSLTAAQFVQDVIQARFHPTHIVEGPTFGFGKGREGTPELLKTLAGEFGCEVHILEAVHLQVDEGDTMLVSSSLIRQLLGDGKVRRAGLCLGRAYGLFGSVVEGMQRGTDLGFPTVNLAVEDQLIPKDGVYAGIAKVVGRELAAAISIGSAPTFGDVPRQIEAHLLDFDGDLYGEQIRLDFLRFLREQQKFTGVEALKAQLCIDIQAVRDAHDNS